MSKQLNIWEGESDPIESICYAEQNQDVEENVITHRNGELYITDNNEDCIEVKNSDVLNLIKALQKAVKLGWNK